MLMYQLWVRYPNGQTRLYHPGPFTWEDVSARVARLNAAARGRNEFFGKEIPPAPPAVEETPPYPTRAPESDAAYQRATDDGTLDFRRRDILAFLDARRPVAHTADDYYAAQRVPTTGYGTQFALLRRAGFIAKDGRKPTRSGAMATAYVRTGKPIPPDFSDKGFFAPYNQPIRATIMGALAAIERGEYDDAATLLRELVEAT